MNLQFVVLTCDSYLDSRVVDLRNTFLSNQNRVFLSDTISHLEDVVGYNTPKNYDGIQDKYIQFFKNYDFSKFEYYFFIDDDTFVNVSNLQKLKLPDSSEKHCIYRLCYLSERGLDYHGNNTGYPIFKIKNASLPVYHPSGGSGFILTKECCLKLQSYLNNLEYNKIPISGHSDVTIGFWLRECNVNMIPNGQLWWTKPEELYTNKDWPFNEQSEKEFITFHYIKDELVHEYQKKYNQI